MVVCVVRSSGKFGCRQILGVGRTVAPPRIGAGRKVRTSKGTVPGNAQAPRGDGKCNRKYVQVSRKGNAVVKSGKPHGMQGQIGLSSRSARSNSGLKPEREMGRSLEVVGNNHPREITVSGVRP